MNYESAYFFLFNQITELIENLKMLQIQCEELAITSDHKEEMS